MAAKLKLVVFIIAYVCFNNAIPSSTAASTLTGNPAVNISPVQPTIKDQEQVSVNAKPAPGEVPYSHYNYRGGPANNQRSPSYPNQAVSNYAREVYGANRAASANPFLALSSDADFQVSAYFGQVFWGLLAVTFTIILCFWLIKFFVGTDVVGGLVEKIRDSGATAKSLDLDRITNIVYKAIDTYSKYAVNEVKYLEDELKGK